MHRPSSPDRNTFAAAMLALPLLVIVALALGWGAQSGSAQRAKGTTYTPNITASATPTCVTGWHVVASPNRGNAVNHLFGLAAVAPDDVWAVGTYGDSDGQARALVEHWDGAQWSIVESPDVSSETILVDVDAVSAADIWAVGYQRSGKLYKTLTEHWNGTQWTVVPGPDPAPGESRLRSVAAVSPMDVWAVGYYGAENGNQTLIEHWDGTQWTVIPHPRPDSPESQLWSVSAISGSDIWAVGFHWSGGTEPWQAIALHWDGAQWTSTLIPALAGDSFLYGVSAAASNDVWAVGRGGSGTLILHWDGAQWSAVPSPGGYLRAVVTLSPNNAWAAGFDLGQTLILHWDGINWTAVPAPGPGANDNTLFAIEAVSAQDLRAAGYYSNSPTGPNLSLTTHYTGPCTTPSATPATAIPTATVCAVRFSDVPPDSTFYAFVQCLACRGIINGYPDGTFLSGNPVTRGQLTKIVSLSAGFTEPVAGQTFEDVAPGSTFYDYVERLASRAVMSGYVCGGPAEPCIAPENRPYFRPSSTATRGQLTRIVSNAAGFQDPPAGQTFEDVPPASTFYTYTQRLTSRAIMQGYPCGNLEPCVPPTNRPYFRPGNNVTRGQTSKIASNTFFPDCGP